METIKRKNGSIKYRAKIRINNQAVSKLFDRKADAEKWKRLKLNEKEQIETYGLPIIQNISLLEYCIIWKQNQSGLSQRSKDSYYGVIKTHLLPMYGNEKLKNIKIHHAQALINSLHEKNISPVRINFIIRFFKQLLNDAIKWDYLLSHPLKNLKKLKEPPKKELYWLPLQVCQFLDANQFDEHYALYVVALNTGMRRGELLGLKWDKVDFTNGQIEISRSRDRYGLKETTKTGKVVYVQMNNTVSKTLLVLRAEKRSLNFVFTHKDGKEIYLEHLSDRIFKDAMTKAGVSRIKFHNLRSTFAANFCMSGGDIYTLSKILGHSKVDMTAKRYAHLHSSHMKRAVEIIAFEANGSQMAHGKFELIASI
jgi:integrase